MSGADKSSRRDGKSADEALVIEHTASVKNVAASVNRRPIATDFPALQFPDWHFMIRPSLDTVAWHRA